jgi:asparagine synthase (glutamine-hydrolysing)
MAHSVEARFPFLDHRLIDLASRLPDHWKIRGLDEKHILKRVAGRHLPPGIARRRKQPYRAPVRQALGALGAAEPLRELLQPDAIARAGIFDPHKVSLLSRRLREGHDLGEVQSMALMLVLTTQLLDRRFVRGFPTSVEARTPDRVVRRTGVLTRAAAS